MKILKKKTDEKKAHCSLVIFLSRVSIEPLQKSDGSKKMLFKNGKFLNIDLDSILAKTLVKLNDFFLGILVCLENCV